MAAGRTRYLVSYDISDPKRLRQVHKTVKDFGWPMQYSVFICDVDAVEMVMLKASGVWHHSPWGGLCRLRQSRSSQQPWQRVLRFHGC